MGYFLLLFFLKINRAKLDRTAKRTDRPPLGYKQRL